MTGRRSVRQHLPGRLSVLGMDQNRHTRLALDGQHAAFDLIDDECLDAIGSKMGLGDLGLAEIGIRRHDNGLGVLV
jgi:hypothetical protein